MGFFVVRSDPLGTTVFGRAATVPLATEVGLLGTGTN